MGIRYLYHRKTRPSLWLLSCVCLLALAGCFSFYDNVPPPPVTAVLVTPTPFDPMMVDTSIPPTPNPDAQPAQGDYVPMVLPGGMVDALPVMSGICFEAAYDAAGRVFVMQSALDHIHFYELADHAQLCRHAVTRYPFDFTTGNVLAGLWSRGTGCTAHHDLLEYGRDDTAKKITLKLKFITEGDCPYDLVRPFWVSIPGAQGYDIQIQVE